MNIKALVGAAALSALVMSAAAAYAQDAGQAPGTMAPIPNPPETHKASSHHHHGKHHKAAKHHKGHKASKAKAAAPDAAAPAK